MIFGLIRNLFRSVMYCPDAFFGIRHFRPKQITEKKGLQYKVKITILLLLLLLLLLGKADLFWGVTLV